MNKVTVFVVQKEFGTNGHTPFLADCSDSKKYVVKHDRGKELGIINEFLACFLLEHWQLPFAPCALVKVPALIITDNPILSAQNKKVWYYDKFCFGSEYLNNAVDVNNVALNFNNAFFNTLDNPLEVLRVALFDAWVENDERKPTNYNMLLDINTRKYKAIPIDHAFIFDSVPHSYLDPTLFVAKDNDHLLKAGFGYFVKKQFTINQGFVDKERNYFLYCIKTCQKYFSTFAKDLQNHYNFSDSDIDKVTLFLFDTTHNQKVFDEHIHRLKLTTP